MRRSIVSAGAIPRGKVIGWADLCFKRPGTGLAPSLAEKIVGTIASEDIEADMVIKETMYK